MAQLHAVDRPRHIMPLLSKDIYVSFWTVFSSFSVIFSSIFSFNFVQQKPLVSAL